jgi:hypothetical protein
MVMDECKPGGANPNKSSRGYKYDQNRKRKKIKRGGRGKARFEVIFCSKSCPATFQEGRSYSKKVIPGRQAMISPGALQLFITA